jgi:purine-nucleoside phosphorylase
MTYEQIKEAAAHISGLVSFVPEIGIILGTGLGEIVEEIDIYSSLDYESIPHFPLSTVEFHTGRLIFGQLGGKKVVAMQGRFHCYEGYSMQEVTFPVRVLKLLGINRLVISNAAGSMNPAFKMSELMAIDDHIGLFMPGNPLIGKNLGEMGERFPDMSEPYDQSMLEIAGQVAQELGIKLHQGVYVAAPGPMLETKAEYRLLRACGADCVGMSTVPETIVARHIGLPVFAVSVITDLCLPESLKKVDIAEIIGAAMKAQPNLVRLITEVIRRI